MSHYSSFPPIPPLEAHDPILSYHLALNEGRFYLLYQPIFDVQSIGLPLLVSVEALLRLQDPIGGVITPEYFLPIVATANDLRERLTWFCLTRAIQDFNEESAPRGLSLHVNVWPSDLVTPMFVERLLVMLKSRGFEPKRLNLEILEEGKAPADMISDTMVRLLSVGIKVGLDDFGVGTSNMSRIFNFSPAFVKIDRIFCPDPDQPLRTKLCNVITLASSMAHSDVIQEGVESKIQLDLVRGLGIEYAQGYFLGRPGRLRSILEEHSHTLVSGGKS